MLRKSVRHSSRSSFNGSTRRAATPRRPLTSGRGLGGQGPIPWRWVITWKQGPDGVWIIKARLCLKGFAEKHFYRDGAAETYSPTADRESHKRIALFAVRNGFVLATMDVGAAFLKGVSFETLKEQYGIDRPPVAFVPDDSRLLHKIG